MAKLRNQEETLNKEEQSQDVKVPTVDAVITPPEEPKVQPKEISKSPSSKTTEPELPELTAEQITSASHQFVDAYNKKRSL
jgi:hypothetical protein